MVISLRATYRQTVNSIEHSFTGDQNLSIKIV